MIIYKGYAGYAFSYGGKWLGGWRRDIENKRDYVKEAYNNAKRQSIKLQGVDLYNCSYDELVIPEYSLIYCDPPYEGTTKYKTGSFDYVKFWDWCKYMSGIGHILFVSEYSAPFGIECIWECDVVSSLSKDTGSKRGLECLYKI